MRTALLCLSIISLAITSCKKKSAEPSGSGNSNYTMKWNTAHAKHQFFGITMDGVTYRSDSLSEWLPFPEHYSEVFGDSMSADYSVHFSDELEVAGEQFYGLMRFVVRGVKSLKYPYGMTDEQFFASFDSWPAEFFNAETNPSGLEIDYQNTAYLTYPAWSTTFGSQEGSSIEILSKSVEEDPEHPGENFMYIRGVFNCKLYNDLDPTQFRTITNGGFCVRVKNPY